MAQNTDVLIIGAGISGLVAARALTERGKRVLVLDKARNPGGRLGTRRVDGGAADHGSQYFTVRSPEFGIHVERWLAEGLVFEWSRGWSDGSLTVVHDGNPRYAVRGGMVALAKRLATGIDVRQKVQVVSVHSAEEGWEVRDEVGSRSRAKALLLTPPVPQTLALLDAGNVRLTDADRTMLQAIDYEPTLTALFHVDGRAHLPAPGAIQRPHAPIFWIADNRQKGISHDTTVVTMQAGPVYSRQIWDLSDDETLRAFRVHLMPFLSDNARIVSGELKRWRYSQPTTFYPATYLQADGQPAPLLLAGDAFGGVGVEGAALSGMAAGTKLADLIG